MNRAYRGVHDQLLPLVYAGGFISAPRSRNVIAMGQFGVGSRAEVSLLITDADTAIAFGSGDVPVLATPRVVALVEQAAMLAVAQDLGEGQTTVAMRVQLDHVQPSSVGTTVRAEAVLEKIEGRRLVFHVSVTDKYGLAATGRITRVMVDRGRFLEKSS